MKTDLGLAQAEGSPAKWRNLHFLPQNYHCVWPSSFSNFPTFFLLKDAEIIWDAN
jgi:hypothetical protein